MMNPYAGHDFLSFFGVLIRRILSPSHLSVASDEIQLLVLIGVALSCAIVGTFLILRRMTMLANALSHTILLGIVLAFLWFPSHGTLSLPVLMIAALITGFLTAFVTSGLQRVTRLQEDASIGLVFSLFFAVGVLLISLFSRNSHLGLELIMGNADALIRSDITVVWTIFGINFALVILFFRGHQVTAFDPVMAKALGFSPALYTYLLMAQTSLTTVGAFRCIGVFMVLALLVVPPLLARLFVHSLLPLLGYAAAIGVGAVVAGVALSRHLLTVYGVGLSTGGIIVTLLFLFFLVGAGCKLTFCRTPLYSPGKS